MTFLSECDKNVSQLICAGVVYTALYQEMCTPVSRNVPKLVGESLEIDFFMFCFINKRTRFNKIERQVTDADNRYN